MPYMKKVNGKSVRDYKRENDEYNDSPEQKKKRAARNAARASLEKEGKVRKGDGKDVGHKKALGKGGSNSRSNLEVQGRTTNRSFSRNKDGSMKSERSKREK